ncbi:hypothetical protein [Bacteroides congonensis]|uniref:hypothetical protein n=1 Tax=Bacteroides congonensis TaxID=1871006 RepID=UPI0025B65EDB|nr:hypothetical protein [Bacteroides congonensis]
MSKEKKRLTKHQQIQKLLQTKQRLLQAKSKVNSKLQQLSKMPKDSLVTSTKK